MFGVGSIPDLLCTVECVRGGDALQSCNRIKAVIETGNVRDSEMLSLQNDQGIMEIQASCMPIHQLQNGREQAFDTPTAPVEGMLAAERLKARKSRWPLGVLLAFGQPATQH